MTWTLSILILSLLVGFPGGRSCDPLFGALAAPMRLPIGATGVAARIRPAQSV